MKPIGRPGQFRRVAVKQNLCREGGSVASATTIGRRQTSIMQVHAVIASMPADPIEPTWARFLA